MRSYNSLKQQKRFFFETYGNDDDVNRYMYVLFILLKPF